MSAKKPAFLCLALFVLVAVVAVGCGSGSSATTGATAPAVTTGSTAGGASTTAGAGGTTVSSTTGGSAGTAAGATVFANYCTSCHGQDATGGAGPNLTHETDQAKVLNQVTNGGQIMPPFGNQLSADQISAVVQYVLSLNGK